MTFITTPFMRSFVGFDSLFDELQKVSDSKENSYPAFNIEKTGEYTYEISLALAGFNENEIDINLNQSILIIKGKSLENVNNKNYLHKGIAKRAFTKQFRLAENVEVNDANFENGILTIKLTKIIPDEEKPRQIKINSVKNNNTILN